MKIVKQGLLQVVGFFGWCTLMCSVLIGLLIASGGLLLLRNEGRQKTFLIPFLVFLGIMAWWYWKNKKTCVERGCETIGHKMTNMALYMTISVIISILFMLYVFIPWWIPVYSGGPLLP